ncbi:MAG: 3-isopropylmalate dehydratase small subunit [Gammaproteobacteria bacterium]|nr:3-isopropylmalate dehydratase small subunit [Gammaproteobacteria bacterium]
MEPIRTIRSKTVVLPFDDIDTDQIIPARFLTTTTKDGLGQHLFSNWRYADDGTPRPDFALNRPEAKGATILVAGRNFGCGSSREHAPWALVDYGFRAVISSEFADIFRNNALKNGLVPVTVDDETHRWLLEHEGAEVTVDLESTTVELPTGRRVQFPIERFSRYCLMNGLDQLGFLLEQEDAIAEYERRHVA